MKIENNVVVAIDYTLTDESGKVLDTSIGRGALDYIHGRGNLIPGLENQLLGKVAGDKFEAIVEAVDGYGEKRDELINEVPRINFPQDVDITVGMEFQAQGPAGVQMITVVKVTDNMITIDANHPLAGQKLIFDVEVVSVREATEAEKTAGHLMADSCGDSCGCSSKQAGDCEGHGGAGHEDQHGDGCGCSH